MTTAARIAVRVPTRVVATVCAVGIRVTAARVALASVAVSASRILAPTAARVDE
jgi:hypothetical protein